MGIFVSFIYDHTKISETQEKEISQALDFAPVFKVNLGKNQMVVPFLEVSYTCRVGKEYSDFEDNYTKNYVRHSIGGGVGLKVYASKWFKKTKYKNNFGIEICYTKAFLLFDNSINVSVAERNGVRTTLFYKF